MFQIEEVAETKKACIQPNAGFFIKEKVRLIYLPQSGK